MASLHLLLQRLQQGDVPECWLRSDGAQVALGSEPARRRV